MATKYVSALTGAEMDSALQDMANHTSEAFAVGTRNGTAVSSGDVTYHNNAKYYAEQADADATSANAAAARAEAAVPAGTAGAVFFDTAQSLTTAQQYQAKANIGAGSTNPNLLDNWYFVGGGSQLGGGVFPINQRGGTSYGTVYGIDRWKCINGTVTINTTGVLISENLVQLIEEGRIISGKTYTISALFDDGTLWVATGTLTTNTGTTGWQIIAGADPNGVAARHYSSNKWQFQIWNNQNRNLVAVKLELGTVSTLANDAPPNYADELDRCQYYFERIAPDSSNLGIGVGIGTGSSLYVPIRIHPKAKFPTLTYSGDIGIGQSAYATNITAFTTSQSSMGACINSGNFQLAVQVSHTAGEAYRLILKTGSYIDFSADL